MNDNVMQVSDINEKSGEQTDEEFWNMPKLADVNHPLVPEANYEYLMREINGVTDMELVTFYLENPNYATLLIGEAGTGKNAILETIAAECNWPQVRVSAGGQTTYEQLIGGFQPVGQDQQVEQAMSRKEAVKRTANRISEGAQISLSAAFEQAEDHVPEGNQFEFQYGVLAQAFKHGWMAVVDEINGMEGENTMPLHQMTEERGKRSLTILETGEVFDPHPNFRLVGTMNPPDYAGTNEMNPAFKSRFFPVEFDYLEEDAEFAILQERTDIVENESEFAARNLISLANDIREQEQSGNDYMTKIGLREILQVAELTEIMDIRNAVETIFISTAEPEDKKGIEEAISTQKFDPNE